MIASAFTPGYSIQFEFLLIGIVDRGNSDGYFLNVLVNIVE
jgi:hypothetical protein